MPFAARTCIVVVTVVTNESNKASYFPEEGNGSNADMCSGVAGPSSSASRGDLFELSDRSNETIILLFPLALLSY